MDQNENLVDKAEDIHIGQVVYSEEEAYNLYQTHAYKLGFSVRKGRQLYYQNEKGKVRMRDFCCSKEGFKNNEVYGEASYNRPDSRTGCQAMVRFSVSKEGVWKISQLEKNHNHDFVPPEQRHLLRSMRNVSTTKGDVINSMVKAGIKVKNIWGYLGEEVGGFDKIGMTMKDMYNFVGTEKLKLIEAGDAQSLVNHLQSRQAEDPMFCYSVQLDRESHLTNVYWRDGKSKIDYECFGDVVVFDTTYRTNKYDLICAPFVGVNHHWKNVMFGCAFLLDESAASFAWLFKVFLESMGNQQPKTIFTDQDAAMSKAIGEIMPDTSHRLCLWHISKNAPSHLGALNSDHKFQFLFHKCMTQCDSEEEFEETWKEMIDGYNLHEHAWLDKMYKIRHKWSTAFTNDTFSGGFRSSQRSESTNSVLGDIVGKTTTLTQFFLAFENMLANWRHKEVEDEFKNSQSNPPRIIEISDTLRQASVMYTHKMFTIFSKEYLEGTGGSTSREIGSCGNVSYHEVVLNNMPNKKYVVTLDTFTHEITCSCHKFESMGILCSHALRIYNISGISKIPNQYFLKRWSKNAREMVYGHRYGALRECGSSNIDSTVNSDDGGLIYRNALMRSFYNLALETQHHKEAQEIMWDLLDTGVQRVQQYFGKLTLDAKTTNVGNLNQNEDDGNVLILNPHHAKTKGKSSARIKGHLEKKRRTTAKDKSNKGKQKDDVQNIDASLDLPTQPYVVPPVELTLNWDLSSSNMPFTSMLQSFTHLDYESTPHDNMAP